MKSSTGVPDDAGELTPARDGRSWSTSGPGSVQAHLGSIGDGFGIGVASGEHRRRRSGGAFAAA
jgi:hypothetical protein